MKRSHILCLIILLCFHALLNYFTLERSRIVFSDADAWHLSEASRYSGIIRDKNGGFFQALQAASHMGLHPQLYQFTLGLITSARPAQTPKDFDLPVCLLNAISLAALLAGVYGIGKVLYGPPQGLLAATLLSFSPLVFGFFRLPILEVPLTGSCALFIWLLLETRRFTRRPESILCGAVLGLAILTKETAFAFLIPPLAAYTIPALLPKDGRQKRWKNLAFAIGPALLIFSVFYLNPQNFRMYAGIGEHVADNTYPDGLFYLKALRYSFIGTLAFPIALPALAACLINIRRHSALVILWFVIPFCAFGFSGFKSARLILPAIPALFLMICAQAHYGLLRRLRYPLILTVLFAFQFIQLNFFLGKNRNYQPYAINKTGLLSVISTPLEPFSKAIVGLITRDKKDKPLDLVYLTNFHYKNYIRLLLSLDKIRYRYFELIKPVPQSAWTQECSRADFLFEEIPNEKNNRPFIGDAEYDYFRNECLPFFEPAEEFPSWSKNGRPAVLHVYKRKIDRNETP